MKMRNRFSIALVTILIASTLATAQPVLLKRDSGTPSSHDGSTKTGWEETMMLTPTGPCSLLELHIYLHGSQPGRDTIYIVGDPSEGVVPPTSFVWGYNVLTEPIAIDYNGTPGWDTIDLRSRGLHYDGYDRIVVQHRKQPAGPWFAADALLNSNQAFLYDPTTNNSLGFPGNYYLAKGDFFVRALVQYDFPNATGTLSVAPPPATLVDVAKNAGLVDDSARVLKAERASIADWNGDGWDDIFLGGQLFQNKKDGTFRNITATAGIQAGACVWGDYDNDGRIDCYAANGGAGDRIYHNNGDGTFSDVTAASGFSNPYPTVTPIWFDYNHDAKLDLYISNGRTENAGVEEYFPDQIWQGHGDGTFTRVTDDALINVAEQAGSPDGSAYLDCWGASPCDFNGDGWTDIFVATYRLAPDLLYQNHHNGTFSDEGEATGVRGVPTAETYYFGHGIGADWGDFNNDGLVDVAVGNLGHPDWRGQVSNPSMIFRNQRVITDNLKDTTYRFTEMHKEMGVKFFEMNAAVVWLDLDMDGYLDLWHCQYSYNVQSSSEPRRLSRMYLNEGPSKNFHMKDITWNTGALVHGAWTAVRSDFDNDGAMDILVASGKDQVKLFHNEVPRNGYWLEFRLVGSPANNVPMDAYGTSVTVYRGGKLFYRDLQGGGSGATASQNTNVLHFGVGDNPMVDSVVVRYPNGVARSFTNVTTNAAYTIPYTGSLLLTSGVRAAGAVTGGEMKLLAPEFADGAFAFYLQTSEPAGDVRVEIVDMLGRRVATGTVDGNNPGIRVLRVQGAVPNGAYFIHAVAGRRSAVAKVRVGR